MSGLVPGSCVFDLTTKLAKDTKGEVVGAGL